MSMMRSVFFNQIDDVWPQIEEFVERVHARSFDSLDTEYVRQALKDRMMQLMVAVKDGKPVGVVITEVKKGGVAINVVAVGGDYYDEWSAEASGLLDKWAESIGARYLCMTGRRGWLKKNQFPGWKETGVVMMKEVDNHG